MELTDLVLVVKAILAGHSSGHTQAQQQQAAEQAVQLLLKRHMRTRSAAERLLALVQTLGP